MYDNYCYSLYIVTLLNIKKYSCMTTVFVSRLIIAQRMALLMQDQTMNSLRALWSLNRVRR